MVKRRKSKVIFVMPRSEALKRAQDKYYYKNAKRINTRITKKRYENPETFKRYAKEYQLNNLPKYAQISGKRRAAKLQRTPKWLDKLQLEHIQMFYDSAATLTKELNIKFEVDHIVPLQGDNVSGLHVPWNLQVITKTENLRKSNRSLE